MSLYFYQYLKFLHCLRKLFSHFHSKNSLGFPKAKYPLCNFVKKKPLENHYFFLLNQVIDSLNSFYLYELYLRRLLLLFLLLSILRNSRLGDLFEIHGKNLLILLEHLLLFDYFLKKEELLLGNCEEIEFDMEKDIYYIDYRDCIFDYFYLNFGC